MSDFTEKVSKMTYDISERTYKQARKDKNFFNIITSQRFTSDEAEDLLLLRKYYYQMAKERRGIKGIKCKVNSLLRQILSNVIRRCTKAFENLSKNDNSELLK